MSLTQEQAEAIYDQGRETVIWFMLDLSARLEETNTDLQKATERIKELERRLNMDSTNSSKPPSSDSPFNEKEKPAPSSEGSNTDPKKKRKRGAQKGRSGKTLELTAHPDSIQILLPLHCSGCGESLEGVSASNSPHRRQVIDLPDIKLHTTEYQSFSKQCPCCAEMCHGEFPKEAASRIQFGPNLTALCGYLSAHQMIPHERIGEMLEDLFGQSVSTGAIDAMLSRTYHSLEEAEEAIKAHLLKEEVLHSDETGFNVGGKLHWLHSISSVAATLFYPHPIRGKEGMDSGGVLPGFGGIVVHDHWSPYRHYTEATHAYCNAHILRELTGIIQNEALRWAEEMKHLLRTMNKVVKQAKEQGKKALSKAQIEKFNDAYTTITRGALNCYDPPPEKKSRGRTKQPKSKNLLDRLIAYQEETLRFLTDFRVPFDNNLAERDLRMTKVKLKVSGCFMSSHGAKRFARLRSYISTLRKNGESILGRLKEALIGKAYVPVGIRVGE